MKTSKILVLLVLALSAGCGSSAPGDGPPPLPDRVRFLLGDPSVNVYDHFMTFAALAGAPADGYVEVLDPAAGDALAQDQGLELLFFLLMALGFDVGPIPAPPVELTYDLPGFLEADNDPLGRYFGRRIPVFAPLEEDEDGLLKPGTSTLYHVGRGTLDVQTVLSGPRRFGLGRVGLSCELRGEFNGTGWDLNVRMDQEVGSPIAADNVEIRSDGVLIGNLGALQEGTAQSLSMDFTINELILNNPILVFIDAAPGSVAKDATVEFETNITPTPTLNETQVHSAGLGNEGLWPMSRAMYHMVHPGEDVQLGLEDFGLLLVGDHGMLQGKSTKDSGFVTTDSSAPRGGPGSKTYRGATIGRDPNAGNYLVADDAAGRQTQPVVAARILVGDWGISIANFDDMLGMFAVDAIVDVGNMTDISPFHGDPMSGEAVYVDNSADAIKFITRDAQNQYVLDPPATLTNAAWPGASGRVVSAFRHTSGDLLFVTDGAPGELWVIPAGASSATKVGDVAAGPRTVRAAGNVAAVGSYGTAVGSGGLGLFLRSAAGSWGYAPFSRAGARSVGIDAKQLADGRVAVASTSFLSDTLIITVLDNTTGEILLDDVIPLPAGCTAPGHCAFVAEPGVAGVFVSCNTSDNFVLMPVSYGP